MVNKLEKKIEKIIWDSLGTKEESEENYMLNTIFGTKIIILIKKLKSLISFEIQELDEVILRLSKEEASCLLLGCPYGENYVKGRKLPKGEDCPNECNAYSQLKEQLREKNNG